ncbi:MAG: HAMP domain-containing protein [Clostridiales bacterium]|nr:HAMP domain-containing protein [Clostridiales bacterium]MBR5059102.1 HAMP domain-containing protein [Clostridiales bacterium]
MIFLVLVSLFASALLSSALYNLAANELTKDSSQEEIVDKARSMADYLSEQIADGIDADDTARMETIKRSGIGYRSYDVLSCYYLLYNANGKLVSCTASTSNDIASAINEINSFCATNMLTNSDNKNLIGTLKTDDSKTNITIVQVPIEYEGHIVSYLIIGNKINVDKTSLANFSQLVFLSTLVVSLAMLIPIYFASKRLIRPLNRVTDVANALGQGNFSIRANDKTKGEIGDLAASVNELAEKLSKSITSVTTERNRLKEIFDIISEGIVSVNKDLQPDYSNNAIATLFEKVPRKNLFTEKLQLIPFEEVWEDFGNCLKTGETYERTIEAKDCAYSSTIVPILDNEKTIIGATGFFRDISEQERLEQTRRDYVANVSHELRTPLTAMRGLVEPLADGMVKKEEDRQRYYGIILHETMRLSRLIDDMLELSRLQARTLAFKTFPFDLNKLLSEFETKFRPVMEEAQLNFSVEYKTGPLPTVMGNPDRVEQIIVILLDNAKKYTPAGGSITISTEYSNETDQVLVSVIDTGQGIHEYDIDHIFDRFYKADRARGKKGTGLGLAIAKELLSYMGETITVKSEYGEGTTFTFTLKRVTGSVWY